MKPDMENMDEVVNRYLPSASKEDVESGGARVLHRLESGQAVASSNRRDRRLFGWRRAAIMASAAAAVILAVFVGLMWQQRAFAVVESVDGSLYRVVEGRNQAIVVGQVLNVGETIRSNGGAGGTLKLADGSRVEMRSKSELVLERAEDGVRIRLSNGSVIVNAAKQRKGHLYVQTKDLTASVIGTVFLVNAEEEGSRVAVIEGEVRVQQGGTEQKLRPGEQISTSATMETLPVKEGIAWSPHAEAHLALLQQSVVAPSDSRDAFEVVSIRATGSNVGIGRGGGQGAYSIIDGCGGLLPIEIDPGRFAVFGTTVHTLITWAYGTGEIHYGSCINLNAMNFVSGGAGWISSDAWDIQAVIPPGSLTFTQEQLRLGDVPKLRRMFQTLLAERFKLVVRRETKSVPGYTLTAEKGAPRFVVPDIYAGGAADPIFKKYVWDDKPAGARPSEMGIVAKEAFISEVIPILAGRLGRPVVDETGIAGKVNLILYYDWAPNPARPLGAPPLSKALEQVGLKLSDTRISIETWVVEKAEKPSEN